MKSYDRRHETLMKSCKELCQRVSGVARRAHDVQYCSEVALCGNLHANAKTLALQLIATLVRALRLESLTLHLLFSSLRCMKTEVTVGQRSLERHCRSDRCVRLVMARPVSQHSGVIVSVS